MQCGRSSGVRPSAPTISGGSGLRFIPPSLSALPPRHFIYLISQMHLFGRDSEIFKNNFSLICESSNMLRLVRGPGCIDHFHLGSSRTNFSKSNISPAPSPGARQLSLRSCGLCTLPHHCAAVFCLHTQTPCGFFDVGTAFSS